MGISHIGLLLVILFGLYEARFGFWAQSAFGLSDKPNRLLVISLIGFLVCLILAFGVIPIGLCKKPNRPIGRVCQNRLLGLGVLQIGFLMIVQFGFC